MGWIPNVEVGDEVEIVKDTAEFYQGTVCSVKDVEPPHYVGLYVVKVECNRNGRFTSEWLTFDWYKPLEAESTSPEQVERPPLSITPRHIVEHQRSIEILEAMLRYKQANKDIPLAWLEELTEYLTKKG